MHAPTRCYPAGDLTPLLCTVRNAQSPIPEIGSIAIRQLIEQLRPHVQRYVARLVAGLRRPSLSVDLHVEHALVSVGASLAVCTADTDSAFYAWVSAITTASSSGPCTPMQEKLGLNHPESRRLTPCDRPATRQINAATTAAKN